MPLTSFVPEIPFEEYRERFSEHFVMERSEDGLLEVRMHTNGGEAIWGMELHRALSQLFEAVGQDRKNHLMILTGTGDHWLREFDVESWDETEKDFDTFKRVGYEVWYRDGLKLKENLLWDVDIPTIAAVNGPGFHTEFALLCDLTICTDDTKFLEPHLPLGLAPGDALYLVFQQLLGLKRANYYMYTAKNISASQALEWGLVNEVVSRSELLPRARELAADILQSDQTVLRITNHIIKRPWRKLLTDDFEMHFAHEMWASLIDHRPRSNFPMADWVDRDA